MDSAQLSQLVDHYRTLSKDDLNQLRVALSKAPYSHIHLALATKAAHDNHTPEAKGFLTLAKLTLPSRARLVDLLEDKIATTDIAQTGAAAAPTEPQPTPIDLSKESDVFRETMEARAKRPPVSDDLIDELMANLEEVHRNRLLLEDIKVTLRKPAPAKKPAASAAPKKAGPTAKAMPATASPEAATKKEQAKPTAKKAKAKAAKKAAPKKPGPTAKAKPQAEEGTDKSYMALIDRFLENEPRLEIDQDAAQSEKPKDLAKSSIEFGDDLISENLAQIMVRQGKVDKAINIYRKLIWKFPQKKAYFAEQIEALENQAK